MADLLPCPFCGSPAERYTQWREISHSRFDNDGMHSAGGVSESGVRCTNRLRPMACNAGGMSEIAWNMRAQPKPQGE